MNRFAAAATALAALASVPLLGCAGAGQPPASQSASQPVATTPPTVSSRPGAVRYVAIGDSYTIGTSVAEDERWPNQLVEALRGKVPLELVANLAVNGASSQDVIDRQLSRVDELRPGFVTLLIGVNDVVRGIPADRYAGNVAQILDSLLGVVPADRLLVVSTPDYTRTPRGGDFGDPQQQRTAIGEVNQIARSAATERGIRFVDIADIAERAGDDRSLVARDRLHPSGRQYELWVERIEPAVARLFHAP
ncbi:MAG TPA: SGNH/GDSL hydrolase family protein [Candidatus Caenarcaniphilales bacterium]|nr:SGNH/GDSL hydrolase family protein [Candidatus Caenarcaniphilales bacterium]